MGVGPFGSRNHPWSGCVLAREVRPNLPRLDADRCDFGMGEYEGNSQPGLLCRVYTNGMDHACGGEGPPAS